MKIRTFISAVIFLFIQNADGLFAQQNSILSNFAAQKNGTQIYLAWTITAGNTCDGISIVRIIEGRNRQKIGEILGVCGNDSIPQLFSFVDSFPTENKVNSYQLELGGAGLSGEASILFLKPGSFILFPNPTKEKLSIIFGNDGKDRAAATITNSTGVILRSLTTNGGTFEVDINDLPDGVYYFSIYIHETGFLKREQFVVVR